MAEPHKFVLANASQTLCRHNPISIFFKKAISQLLRWGERERGGGFHPTSVNIKHLWRPAESFRGNYLSLSALDFAMVSS